MSEYQCKSGDSSFLRERSRHDDWLISKVKRTRGKILILGPFAPQTLSLSSSDSSSPRIGRQFSPISIPYPTHSDCYAPPEAEIFDQLEYESSVPDIDFDIDLRGKVDNRVDPVSSVSPSTGDWTPWVDNENEHRQTVKLRLEAMVSFQRR